MSTAASKKENLFSITSTGDFFLRLWITQSFFEVYDFDVTNTIKYLNPAYKHQLQIV